MTVKKNNSLPKKHIRVACVGDVMFGGRAESELKAKGIRNICRRLMDFFDDCDLVLLNLEAPITFSDSPYQSKPYNFKTEPLLLQLFDQRFVFSIANNHIDDFGTAGLADTIFHMTEQQLNYAGAGATLSEAGRPCIIDVGGVKIGILSAADPRNRCATNISPGIFPATIENLANAIENMQKSVQIIFVSLHVGLEHSPVPSPFQIKLAQTCIDSGAALVHFHHSHSLSGHQLSAKNVILWGTGNFIFPPSGPFNKFHRQRGAIWKIEFNLQEKRPIGLKVMPVTLDRNGFPRISDKKSGEKITRMIHKLSQRIEKRKTFWHLIYLVHPHFLSFTLYNYARYCAMNGIRATWQLIFKGIKQQAGLYGN